MAGNALASPLQKVGARTEREYETALIRALGKVSGHRVYEEGQQISSKRERIAWYRGMLSYLRTGDSQFLHQQTQMLARPVDMLTFLYDPFFLNVPRNELWQGLVDELVEINSGKYIECVWTGAIGTGKSTGALYTNAYQLYLLSCYASPQQALGIAETDEILFVFQNMNKRLSKGLDFERFQAMLQRSEYFRRVFPPGDAKSVMEFPHRIKVEPLSGNITAAIGANVFGGIIEEVNFMAVVENSKMSLDGDAYNQARGIYNTISIRRKSRFMRFGRMPGILNIVSSRNYPGQLTDEKEEERRQDIARTGTSPIYVYDKRLWDLVPERYDTGRFPVFLGDMSRHPRVLESREDMPEDDQPNIMDVPNEFRGDFERDLMRSIRDIAGHSTLAKSPFILNSEAVDACMSGEHVLSREWVDFVTTTVQFVKERLQDPEKPRFAHVDLALTSDSAGLSIGHVAEFMKIERGEGEVEIMPKIVFDVVLEVKPPHGGEIEFSRIRQLLYNLRAAGVPIRWVSFDSYQSVDSQQILRQKGFITGTISMDTSMVPHEFTKSAIYDHRLVLPAKQTKLRRELLSLEVDQKKKKIDHPANGSKDLADSVAGVVFGLTTRRELWARAGLLKYLPKQIGEAANKDAMKDQT